MLELLPPEGAGPVRVGMGIDEAERALSGIEGFAHLGSRNSAVPTRGRAEFDSGLTVVALTMNDRVNGVEIFRPLTPVPVTYAGIDVFATRSEVVIERLRESTRVISEDDGALIVAPDLLLSLSRLCEPETDDEDEDGAYFDSVLVAPPGYYDGPS
ncbi:hypothetical protein ACFY36_32770 [Actinoplanes sp. NPDC000266]